MGFSQPDWLRWAQEVASLAQSGLAYTPNEFDRERFVRLRELAAEVIAAHTDLDQAAVSDLFAAERGYATPKVDVRALVLREGRVLLVQERSDGRWALPGGWIDVGDTVSQAAEREVREEAGLRVKAERLLAIYDNRKHNKLGFWHILKLCVGCTLQGGELAPSLETAAADFFAPDALPELSLGRTTPEQLERLLAGWSDPSLPVAFD